MAKLNAMLRQAGASLLLAAAVSTAAAAVSGAGAQTFKGEQLVPAVLADRPVNGVATTAGGRIFVDFPSADPGVRIGEKIADKFQPYPDASWNQWQPGHDPARSFVLANSLRLTGDGSLWVVDAGSMGLGKPAVKGAAKLVQIDTGTNQVKRIYDLSSVATQRSFVDDVRFNGHTAYLTDAGEPGLIVLDLDAGRARRVLDGDRSVTAGRPSRAEGAVLTGRDGKPVMVNADQLEVSPDGKWLYYMPASGPIYRVETRFLDDAGQSRDSLAQHVEMFAEVPSTGGTAMDAAGNIYITDPNQDRILKLTPDAQLTVLVSDPSADLARCAVDRRRGVPLDTGRAAQPHGGVPGRNLQGPAADHHLQTCDRRIAAAPVMPV